MGKSMAGAAPKSKKNDANNVEAPPEFGGPLDDEPEMLLLEKLHENPDLYGKVRVYQVNATHTTADGKTRRTRAAQLGELFFIVFEYTVIYTLLETTYGGGSEVAFDVMLVKRDNRIGPNRRFWPQNDRRPNANGGGVDPFAYPMGGSNGATSMPQAMTPGQMQAQMQQMAMTKWMMQQMNPGPPAESSADKMLAVMMPLVMTAMTGGKDSTEKGIQTGLAIAEKAMEAAGGASEVGEVATAVSDSIGAIAMALSSRGKDKDRRSFKEKQAVKRIPSKDIEQLGWLITQAIREDWPPERSAKTLLMVVGAEQLAEFSQDEMALAMTLRRACAAHTPLQACVDEGLVQGWAEGVVDFLRAQAGDDDDGDGQAEPAIDPDEVIE